MLTPTECSWIAQRLLQRAASKAKDLRQAREREVSPELIRELENDIAESTRLALKLQGIDP